ncbi:hypothetical protein MD484_g7886, partial [Candolleomyces efflorescens]
MITLYDFPSGHPTKSFSPYAWRVRLALNLKGIEHKTEWIQYHELEKRLKEFNIPPSATEEDGTPIYTIPAIYDPSTNSRISDSLKIIEYLEATYPDTPKLLSPGTEVLTTAFEWAEKQHMRRAIWPFTVLKVAPSLDEKSSAKYVGIFEAVINMKLEEFGANTAMKDKLWKDIEKGYNTVDGWLRTTSKSPESQIVGPWVTGKEIKLADIILAADLAWPIAVFGEDSEEWRRIGAWNDGRWRDYWGLVKQLALNLKGIEHNTEWIQYSDIEKRFKELDIPPSEIRSDGTPAYTIPAISDSSTNVRISDSVKILEYLDKAYPDTHQLVDPGTEVLTAAFAWAERKNMRGPTWPLVAPNTIISGLSGPCSAKYRRNFEAWTKYQVEELQSNPVLFDKVWKDAREGYAIVDGWLNAASKSTDEPAGGPWITGKDIKLADLILAADLAWPIAVFGEDSEEWRKIGEWNDGRWRERWGLFKQYAIIH